MQILDNNKQCINVGPYGFSPSTRLCYCGVAVVVDITHPSLGETCVCGRVLTMQNELNTHDKSNLRNGKGGIAYR